jgi:hypothetical protein
MWLFLGYVWALPVTLAGRLVAWVGGADYAVTMRRDWTRHYVAREGGLCARFFERFGVAAFSWGAVIVYARAQLLESPRLVTHERRHTQQAYWLGPMLPFAYGLLSLVAFLWGGHPYFDNWLEQDARAAEEVTK